MGLVREETRSSSPSRAMGLHRPRTPRRPPSPRAPTQHRRSLDPSPPPSLPALPGTLIILSGCSLPVPPTIPPHHTRQLELLSHWSLPDIPPVIRTRHLMVLSGWSPVGSSRNLRSWSREASLALALGPNMPSPLTMTHGSTEARPPRPSCSTFRTTSFSSSTCNRTGAGTNGGRG
jgi:hypothetical protein